MTKEDKKLLLKDLCARLPYKPIVHAKWSYREPNGEIKYNERDRKLEINDFYEIWGVKPYLRPMSSITEEEKKELGRISCEGNIEHKYGVFYRSQDYLNSIHVDYRNLIEKGLALEAPKGMYDKKEK